MRQAKRKFESDVAEKAKSNPKAFWYHVSSKLKTKVGVSLMNNVIKEAKKRVNDLIGNKEEV